MRFLVLCRAIQPPPVGYMDQLELLEATQERLRSGSDSRIVETMSFAGERSFAVVVDAATARALDHTVFGLPAEPLLDFEVHVLMQDQPRAPAQVAE